MTTRAPSPSTQPKTVNTGASAGSLTASRVEGTLFVMRGTGIGRGGCRRCENGDFEEELLFLSEHLQ